MKIRNLPFGYKMEGGRPVILPKEAEIVAVIFQQYAAGSSYLDLVQMLEAQPIPYDIGRFWNKNMIARILGDSRYLGQMEYPAIIDEGLFLQITQKRGTKQIPPLTDTQKALRQLSGQRVSENAENEVLILLNTLIGDPNCIQQPSDSTGDQGKIGRLEADLETILDSQPIDEDAARKLIRQITTAQYEAISSAEYETQRLRHIFSQAEPMKELDAELLKSTVSQIKIDGKEAVSIRLKNDQIISLPTTPTKLASPRAICAG